MMYHPNINTNHIPLSSDGQVHQSTTLFNNHNHPTSPCIQYEDALYELTWQEMHDLYFNHQDLTTMDYDQTPSNMRDLKRVGANKEIEQQYTIVQQTTTKRRTSKKDRHSKITTAQGLRDRRMRLSLPVARKFFGLQDMLGFDKASKTIEWLLIQSSSAIKHAMRSLQPTRATRTSSAGAANRISSTSECEVISGTYESKNNEHFHVSDSMERKMKSFCNEGKKEKAARRGAPEQLVRESRKLARERARKRTMEKRIPGKSNMLAGEMNLGSWSQFKTAEESSNVMAYQGLKEMEDLSSLVIANQWNTPEQNQYGGFLWQ